MALLLIVEDQEDLRELVAYNLERAGNEVVRAADGLEALKAVRSRAFDLIISDVMMPKMDGLELCARVREHPDLALTPFLFVSAKGTPGDQYRGLRAGADDYVTKPFELDDLMARVRGRLDHRERLLSLQRDRAAAQQQRVAARDVGDIRAARERERSSERDLADAGAVLWSRPALDAEALRAQAADLEERFTALAQCRRERLIGGSDALLSIFDAIIMAAAGSDPVLVIGETGSGKTGVAESIHLLSERAGGPWLTVNAAELAAGDPSIVMGKLFGVGRASGLPDVPKDGRPGLLEDAHGGTLFIDEVALLPAQAQHLLLLPVEGRPFRPAVGTGAERRVDVKLVFATNRDLADEVERGAFPRDLYERIAGETVRVPPLRERLDDIPVLADHFLAELRAEVGDLPALSAATLEALRGHDWPGNVRELRRLVRAAAKRARLQRAPRIDPAHLPDEMRRAAVVSRSPSSPPAVEGFSEREAAELEALRRAHFKIAVAESRLGYSARSRSLSHRLRGMSFKALKLANWDAAAAAVLLAGDAGDLQGKVERRLRTLLDGLGERRGESPETLLAHLLAEHRPYALEALTRARTV